MKKNVVDIVLKDIAKQIDPSISSELVALMKWMIKTKQLKIDLGLPLGSEITLYYSPELFEGPVTVTKDYLYIPKKLKLK